MAEVLDVLNAFSAPLKLGWAIWLSGALLLVVSHRLLRVTMARAVVSTAVPAGRRPFAAVTKPAPTATPLPADVQDAVIQSPVAPGVAAMPVAASSESPDRSSQETHESGSDGEVRRVAAAPKPVRRRRRAPTVPTPDVMPAFAPDAPAA